MTVDDKFGIGAGLVALGLAAGVILFAQLRPDVFFPSTVQELASETPAKGEAAKPAAVMESPHRGLVLPEAICDGIVCVLALPAGICFFWLGAACAERRAAIGVGHFLRRGHWVGRGFSALPFSCPVATVLRIVRVATAAAPPLNEPSCHSPSRAW